MLYVSGQERQPIFMVNVNPEWELRTSGYSTYTTDCKWEANLELINKPPEWWMPPAKRKK